MNKRFLKLFLFVFLSLGILISIPTAYFGIMSFKQKQDDINERFISQQESFSNSLSSIIEDKFSALRETAYFLQNEDWISSFHKLGYSSNEFNVVKRISYVKRIKSILGNTQIAKDLLIFMPRQNAIISSNGWFTPSQYTFTFYNQHQNLYKEEARLFYIPWPCGDPNCTNAYCRNVIPIKFSRYALKLPYDIYFTLDKRLISEYVARISSGSEIKIRISKEGVSLFDTIGEAPIDKVITSSASEVSYYFSYPPIDPVLISSVINNTTITYSLFFLLVTILTIGLAILITKPIDRIISKLPSVTGTPGANPLRLIERAMDSMSEAQIRLGLELDNYKRFISNDDLLFNILISGDTEKYLSEIMDFWPWFNTDGYCAIALIDCQTPMRNVIECDYAQLLRELGEVVEVEYRVMNILGSDAALLLYFGNDQRCYNLGTYENQYTNIRERITGISSWFKVGYGSINRGVAGIQTSYHQARKQNLAATYSDQAQDDVKYFYPTSMELQLLNNLKLAKHKVCLEILVVIFNQNAALRLESIQYARCLSILSDTLARFAIENDIDLSEYPSLVLKNIQVYNFNTCETTLREFCEYLCNSISHIKNRSYNDKRREIYEYVINHASDSNLSLHLLSDKFKIPISTLSKAFKDIAGSNFYDFLSGVRVERAIEKLHEGRVTITEISHMVGYDTYASFKRAFVKHIGINPSEYKTLLNDK